MTFDSREKSRFSGQPLECFRFAQAGNFWLFTSADEPVTLPSGVYTPATIERGGLDHSEEDVTGALTVTVPRTNPVAQLFVTFAPPSPVQVTLYRAHRGEESTPVVWFSGTVSAATFRSAAVELECIPLRVSLRRRIPILGVQNQCNWPLYSEGCGIAAGDFRDTCLLNSVSGVTVVSADFALRADGWFRNGWLETAGGERRFIVEHVGDTVTLMNVLAGLGAGQSVFAFAGCDRTEAVCAGKFNNLANHLGFPRVPGRNPHGGSIV